MSVYPCGGRAGDNTFCDLCQGKDFMFGKAVPGTANPLKETNYEGLQIHSQFGEDSACCQTRPFRSQNTYGWILQAFDPLELFFTWIEEVVSREQELLRREHESSISSRKRFQHPDIARILLTRGGSLHHTL